MKKRRYTPLLIAAGLLTAMNMGTTFAAEPDAPKTPAADKKPAANRRKPTVSKRILVAIEAKTGKALTDDQKRQLGDAMKARQDAIEAANEKYLSDTAAITGLTVDDIREINKPAKRAAPEAPKPDAAPGDAAAGEADVPGTPPAP